MSHATTKDIVNRARANGTGAAAFNVITLEHAEAVIDAAHELDLPVIVQVSENALAFHRGDPLPIARAVMALAERVPQPVALHLDHATSLDLCKRSVDAGFSSVMFDASQFEHARNVELTRAASRWAHSAGIWIESELGAIGGKGGAHALGVRTVPPEAQSYVEETGVDALAVAVGSSHAMEHRTARLDQRLIVDLRAAVAVPLVLHGSSGLPDEELVAAVGNGMTKINVGTALNSAFTLALETSLAGRGGSSDPRPHLSAARDSTTAVVRALLAVIASTGGR